jgi:hypothetical protein
MKSYLDIRNRERVPGNKGLNLASNAEHRRFPLEKKDVVPTVF